MSIRLTGALRRQVMVRRTRRMWRADRRCRGQRGKDDPVSEATRCASGTSNTYDVGNRWAVDPHPQAGACHWSVVGLHTERKGGWVTRGSSVRKDAGEQDTCVRYIMARYGPGIPR
jgi:hypothetical protein